MSDEMKEIKEMFDLMTMEMANFSLRQNQIEEQHEKAINSLRESINAIQKGDRGKGNAISEGAEIYTPSGNPMIWATFVSTGNPPGFQSLAGYQYGAQNSQQFQTPAGEHYQRQGYSRVQPFFTTAGQIPSTGQGGEGFHHATNLPSSSHQNGSMTSLTKKQSHKMSNPSDERGKEPNLCNDPPKGEVNDDLHAEDPRVQKKKAENHLKST
ncbi:uncharacterized protein LOC107843216 isoform X2 [Capsicum annuum]|uniref:uncharacterized protein LOC107843216 isoform X2 n=1 Tax=Capsicum annuum TaxID=4072 RepID=UPI0007BEFA5C|nr:uncharacterized protein LOC107843216 isoform X2 [Capsicum annuum]